MDSYHSAATRLPHDPTTGGHISYTAVAGASALVSLWLILLDPVMTSDAVLILHEARTYLTEEGSTSLVSWPRTIAGMHQLTGMSLPTTAHLLNSLLHIILCVTFVATVKSLGGSRRVQLFAATLILVHPLLAGSRSDLSPDPGYWAFALLSLQQLVVYCRNPDWSTGGKWFCCIGIASLFRLEALLLANLAPLALWVALPRRRRKNASLRLLLPIWVITVALLLSGALASLAAIQGSPLPLDSASWSGSQLFPALTTNLAQLAQNPGQDWTVAGSLVGTLLATLGAALTAICLLLVLLGWWRGSPGSITRPARSLINAHFVVFLAILSLYLLLGHGLDQRDATLAVLMLLLYLAFILGDMWVARPLAWKVLVLSSLLLLASTSLYNRKYEQQYVADAAAWLRSTLPAGASLFSNSPYIALFTQRPAATPSTPGLNLEQILSADNWRQHQFLALHQHNPRIEPWYQLARYPQLDVLRVFAGRDHGMVVVLKNNAAAPRR